METYQLRLLGRDSLIIRYLGNTLGSQPVARLKISSPLISTPKPLTEKNVVPNMYLQICRNLHGTFVNRRWVCGCVCVCSL